MVKSYERDTHWTIAYDPNGSWIYESIYGRDPWMKINETFPCIESPYILVKYHRTCPTIFMKWTKYLGLFYTNQTRRVWLILLMQDIFQIHTSLSHSQNKLYIWWDCDFLETHEAYVPRPLLVKCHLSNHDIK